MNYRKTYTFNCYADPGHSWVRVSKDFLARLGIEKLISPYSYMRGNYAYLEEDCDYGILYTNMKDRGIGIKNKMHYSEKRSKIRNYESYKV